MLRPTPPYGVAPKGAGPPLVEGGGTARRRDPPFCFFPNSEPLLFVPQAEEGPSGDETDDEEERLRSSWHHRALLGDESRRVYADDQCAEVPPTTEHDARASGVQRFECAEKQEIGRAQ